MGAKDPKQVVIQAITNPNPQLRREERGILAKPESILFIKEKDLQYIYACVVSYTSTTNQEWYNTSLVIKRADGSFFKRSEMGSKAENRFYAGKETQAVYQHQPWLHVSGGGKGSSTQTTARSETISETVEGGATKQTVKISSIVSLDEPMKDISGYRFWVGYLTANGHDVASVRMIPHMGPVEEDEVQDNTVLFLGECSAPMTFEFYSPSHTLIATQRWDV